MHSKGRHPAISTIAFFLVALSATGCLRARLLHPPSSTTVTHVTPADSLPALQGAGGTMKGPGVTLQASFGLATPGDLTGHGVRLHVGN